MRLRIEVTQTDITKAKTRKWITPPWRNSPVYRAIVRQTGYRHVDVGVSKLMVRSNSRGVCFAYDFPPEARQWLQRYYHGQGQHEPIEPFTFDLELDTRGAKFLCLNPPCPRCGDYPRESGKAVCSVCRDYRERMEAYWR
ncbi:MAG: hypothetical protein ETSY1_36850 [Candidatus Entotheonella factor]|uniref:Uncharacterized protein n=1 Tax=Entotheonella factor TaxID=1429438 RepID=W4L7C6_ENTF1|nr:hypothetical protein [Candidatus Entotheonella palauensis]ETW93978.1 MAG: hypothetical protein ETSY1_36850 [Candidatus Entotheonella factor]